MSDSAYCKVHHGHKARQDIPPLGLVIHTVGVVKVQYNGNNGGKQHTPVKNSFLPYFPILTKLKHFFDLHQTPDQPGYEQNVIEDNDPGFHPKLELAKHTYKTAEDVEHPVPGEHGQDCVSLCPSGG